MRCVQNLPNGIVYVSSKGLPFLIPVKQWRKYAERQGCRNEESVFPKRIKNLTEQFARDGGAFVELHVSLGARRLMSRRHPAVNPIRFLQHSPRLRYLRL